MVAHLDQLTVGEVEDVRYHLPEDVVDLGRG
jgi:hypothetical protein